MRKKILFIQPPAMFSSKIVADYLKYPPMGVISLASILRQHNYEPFLFDSTIVKNPLIQLENVLRNNHFDIVGITFSSITAEGAFWTAQKVKKINPSTIVIGGGYHPTVMTKQVIANRNFDFVVRGEGEITFPELLEGLENKMAGLENIRGLAFRRGKEIIINPPMPLIENLDILPLPAYDLLQLDAYSSPSATRKPYITYIRSRGCPFNCNFCGVQQMFTRRYRFESSQKTVENIDYLVQNFGIKEILFKDSEFVINQKSVMELCDLLIEKKYDLVWGCNARVDMVSQELLKKMKEAGCNQITYGVESGDQRILNRIRKGITLEQTRKAVALTKSVGIKCITNFMFGNPEETKASMEATIKFAIELDPDFAAFNNLLAFPGSDVYEEAIKNNWFLNGPPKSFTYESLRLNATNVSIEELDKFIKKALFSFYFRPRYILKRLRRLTLGEIKNNLSGLRFVIKKLFVPL